MKKRFFFLLFISILINLLPCYSQTTGDTSYITILLRDTVRQREIPIALYLPQDSNKTKKELVIFSHGYGENKGGDYLLYSYLTENLALKGYTVVSIQHELPDDDLLAMEGDLRITRLPNWQRGAQNIYFVLSEMKRLHPELNYERVTMIGHSNGGDISALFAEQHPELLNKLITLDQRRYPLLRTTQPRVYSLRSYDYPADEGVLPTAEEQQEYKMRIIFTRINYSEMDNKGSDQQHREINEYIERFLREE